MAGIADKLQTFVSEKVPNRWKCFIQTYGTSLYIPKSYISKENFQNRKGAAFISLPKARRLKPSPELPAANHKEHKSTQTLSAEEIRVQRNPKHRKTYASVEHTSHFLGRVGKLEPILICRVWNATFDLLTTLMLKLFCFICLGQALQNNSSCCAAKYMYNIYKRYMYVLLRRPMVYRYRVNLKFQSKRCESC